MGLHRLHREDGSPAIAAKAAPPLSSRAVTTPEAAAYRVTSASRSTWAGSETVGSRTSSSTPISANPAMAYRIDSGDRCALPAIISAVSRPIGS